jgi:hypothetical protein
MIQGPKDGTCVSYEILKVLLLLGEGFRMR